MMEEIDLPKTHTNLEQRLRKSVNGSEEGTIRLRRIMAAIVLGQMLPPGAIKGGTAMKIRIGNSATRFSKDLDVARKESLQEFLDQLADNLIQGWNGFTGTVRRSRKISSPKDVPTDYIMAAYDVKLQYAGRSFTTVELEIGHDELGDTADSITMMSDEMNVLFKSLGFPAPAPVAVIAPHHQLAQKLHATSAPNSERAHDLVDIQLLVFQHEPNLPLIRTTCERLFTSRKGHSWPPIITENPRWESLYGEAARDLPVIQDLQEAIDWTNKLISQILSA